MTLEEAKKILEKEGFVVERFLGVLVEDVKTASWEKIEVSEAMRVVAENGYLALMEESKYKERKARLKKECENNTKAPVFGEVKAGDGYLKKATDAFILQANEIMRLKKKNAELLEAIDKVKEGNPALKEASSQFNDALLDEQAKKIKCLGKEIAKLNGIIHDKNAILSDVAEELRLTKIREKNLTEVGQKYMKENEELKKELEKMTKLVETVRKGSKEYCDYGIAAEKMIQKMAKEFVNDSPVSSKDYEQYRLWANGYRFNPQLPDFSEEEEIRALKLQISALEKRGNGIDWKRNADAIKLYVNRASRERLWNPINQEICNEQELSFIINHGGKRVKYALRFDGTDIVYECSDPDKKPSFFRDDSVGAVTNLKDCSPAKDTHPAVDIAEEGGDHSGVIVLCGKDVIDAIKKMK